MLLDTNPIVIDLREEEFDVPRQAASASGENVAGLGVPGGGSANPVACTSQYAYWTEIAANNLGNAEFRLGNYAEAVEALPSDISPIDDHRASAAYRMSVARSFLRRALKECQTWLSRSH